MDRWAHYQNHETMPRPFRPDCPWKWVVTQSENWLQRIADLFEERWVEYNEVFDYPPPVEHHTSDWCHISGLSHLDRLEGKNCHMTIQFCETAPWEPCYPEEFSWTEAFCVTQEIWTWGDDVWIYDTEELTVTTPGQGR